MSAMFSVAEVAARAGLSAKAVRGAIARGDLAAYKLSGRLRVAPEDYAAWLDRSRVEPDMLRPSNGAMLRPSNGAMPPSGGRAGGLRALDRTEDT